MNIRALSALVTSTVVVTATATAGHAAELNRSPEPSSHADNGVVTNSVQVGDDLFIGGTFTSVDGQPRVRLAALDAATGELTSFRVDVDGEVTALATDGVDTLFLAGKFNHVDGVRRNNLAAVDVPTQTVTAFNPSPKGIVRSLDHVAGRVVFGGGFTKVGSTAVPYLAAADAATGALVGGFPSADGVVYTVRAVSGNVWVGGAFSRVGGLSRPRVAVLSSGGQVLAYRTSPGGPVHDLAVDGTGAYLALGGGLPTGNSLLKTTAAGDEVWRVTTDGNLQAVEILGDTVYAAGHFNHLCGTTTSGCGSPTTARKTFVVDTGGSAPNARSWARFNTAKGVWDVTAAGGNLYALGEFTKVNGTTWPRVARFA
ncbi:MAG TPA: hypothetical protein VH915_14135 [Pedococcus sp.]|jgi:hypothetical protein